MARMTETRDVRGFAELDLRGPGDAELEQGDGESLVIEADEAVMPRIRSEVREGRLVLGLDIQWWEWVGWWIAWLFLPDKTITYRVGMREVRGLRISGSGSIHAGAIHTDRCDLSIVGSGSLQIGEMASADTRMTISGSGGLRVSRLEAEDVTTDISGSGDVEVSGTAQDHDVRISGSGRVKAATLETQQAAVWISGSGSATVNAREEIDIQITGSGSVDDVGQPRVSQRVTGSGSIRSRSAA